MKRLAGYLPGGLVAGVTAVLTAMTRWAGPSIYCGDGWFHVRYATILRTEGIARTFPWWQESFLATRFTDFNLLYHLLLIPFTLFWILQTREWWHEGAPGLGESQPTSAETSDSS